jgi:DNA-binding NarL/FixJ family response regulator
MSTTAGGAPIAPAAAHRGDALRVVVADDVAHVRSAIARLLERAGFVVAAQVASADTLAAEVAELLPDVVVCDIRMPPDGKVAGLVAAEQIVTSHPSMGVLLLSTSLEPRYARRLVAARAHGIGYLSKDRVADLEDFVAAVRTVAGGGTAFDAGLGDR